MDIQANAAGRLGDHGALLEGIVYTLDAIVLHADEEA